MKRGNLVRIVILVCIHSFLLQGEHPNNGVFVALLQKMAIPYFRISPYYKKQFPGSNDSSLVGLDHCHPNELGHRIIAEAMLSELKHNRFIELK